MLTFTCLKKSFIFNRIDSHGTTFKLFKRVYKPKPTTNKKPFTPSLVLQTPSSLPWRQLMLSWTYCFRDLFNKQHSVGPCHIREMNGNIRFFNVHKIDCLGLETEFLGDPTKIPKVLYHKIPDGDADCVPGTGVLEDRDSCCTSRWSHALKFINGTCWKKNRFISSLIDTENLPLCQVLQ